MDEDGKETFVTGGAFGRIPKASSSSCEWYYFYDAYEEAVALQKSEPFRFAVAGRTL